MTLDLTGTALGNNIAAATAPTPPTPVPPATQPPPLPANPTSAEIDGYTTAMTAFTNYQSYIAQLSNYNMVVGMGAATWIKISHQILTYISDNALVTTAGVASGTYIKSGNIT